MITQIFCVWAETQNIFCYYFAVYSAKYFVLSICLILGKIFCVFSNAKNILCLSGYTKSLGKLSHYAKWLHETFNSDDGAITWPSGAHHDCAITWPLRGRHGQYWSICVCQFCDYGSLIRPYGCDPSRNYQPSDLSTSLQRFIFIRSMVCEVYKSLSPRWSG